MAPVNGTQQLQSANVTQMTQAEAIKELKSLGTANGSNRLRENSISFSKATKRTAFRLALHQFKHKICDGNQALTNLWEANSTGKGKHDMTGDELDALMTVMEPVSYTHLTLPTILLV